VRCASSRTCARVDGGSRWMFRFATQPTRGGVWFPGAAGGARRRVSRGGGSRVRPRRRGTRARSLRPRSGRRGWHGRGAVVHPAIETGAAQDRERAQRKATAAGIEREVAGPRSPWFRAGAGRIGERADDGRGASHPEPVATGTSIPVGARGRWGPGVGRDGGPRIDRAPCPSGHARGRRSPAAGARPPTGLTTVLDHRPRARSGVGSRVDPDASTKGTFVGGGATEPWFPPARLVPAPDCLPVTQGPRLRPGSQP
jgi:hypothetical protein